VTAIHVASLTAQWLIVGGDIRTCSSSGQALGEDVERGDIPLALGMVYGPFVAILIATLEVLLQGLPEASDSGFIDSSSRRRRAVTRRGQTRKTVDR